MVTGGRRARRGKPWFAKKYSAMELATKAYRGIGYLRGLVNSEMLHYRTSGDTTADQNGVVTHLTAIGQGDTDALRTGNSIFVRKLLVRWSGFQNVTNTPNGTLRCVVFIDVQQVADTAPTMADVLQTTASTVAPLSSLNDANLGRFKILYNKIVNIGNGSNGSHTEELYLDMEHHVRYNGTASTDIQKGGIYVGFISDQSTAGTVPTVRSYTVTSYHDN